MGDDSDDLLSVLDSEKTSSAKGPKFQGNFMTRAKLQEQMKQKRTKKVNPLYNLTHLYIFRFDHKSHKFYWRACYIGKAFNLKSREAFNGSSGSLFSGILDAA